MIELKTAGSEYHRIVKTTLHLIDFTVPVNRLKNKLSLNNSTDLQ